MICARHAARVPHLFEISKTDMLRVRLAAPDLYINPCSSLTTILPIPNIFLFTKEKSTCIRNHVEKGERHAYQNKTCTDITSCDLLSLCETEPRCTDCMLFCSPKNRFRAFDVLSPNSNPKYLTQKTDVSLSVPATSVTGSLSKSALLSSLCHSIHSGFLI